jgi:hypothetical protein
MMKTWQYITAAALIVGAFFFGLIASCSYFKSNPEIEIKWLTKTETVYTGNPQSLGDYERCYKSPLTIDAKLIGKELNVSAEDACKRAERKMRIDVIAPMKPHVILFQPLFSFGRGVDKSFGISFGGMISYYHYWPVFRFEVGLGAGVGYISRPTGGDFLLSPGISIKF